ncbi:unnamed protein product [Adineta ricciae]|uniref:Uncharacterized protein n=3 Tax=Adineta ricciae TaxID=249248 RepID=A0A813YJJ8_ADIRI|nr:unnamed protein product [Adineta ricciae]
MYPNMRLRRNYSWDNWGSHGYTFGVILLIIGILTQVLEYPRIYNGPTNEDYGLNLVTEYYNHWWPWTYAASIFGLLTFVAGLMGIIAGYRRSYGSILTFFVMCLCSTLLAVYLIVYFAFIIAFYRSMNKDQASQRTSSESVAYGLASTQLAIACVNVLASLLAAVFSARAIALCVPKGVLYDDVRPTPRQAGSTTSQNLSCEPDALPAASTKSGLDANYENMIENLLLQQVLLYTRQRSKTSPQAHTLSPTSNSLFVRQPVIAQNDQAISTSPGNSSSCTHVNSEENDEEPTLCLIESHEKNSSDLIQDILKQYNRRSNKNSRFDRDLMELIVERNRKRRSIACNPNNTFYSRLQWLAIGLVIDRLFFYVYFTATILSYFVTLWLIPFSHPKLTIDINKL